MGRVDSKAFQAALPMYPGLFLWISGDKMGSSAGIFLNKVGALMFNIFLMIGSINKKPIAKLISRCVSQSYLGKKATTKRESTAVRINRIMGINHIHFFISCVLMRYRTLSNRVKAKLNKNPGFNENISASTMRLTTIQMEKGYRTPNNLIDTKPMIKLKKILVISSANPKWMIKLFREKSIFIDCIAVLQSVSPILAHKYHFSFRVFL